MASSMDRRTRTFFIAADGLTSGDDHVHGGDGHDTIRGLGTKRVTALSVR
jgi:hypothetical protein